MMDVPERLVSVWVVQRLKKLVVNLAEPMFTFTETSQILSFHDALRQEEEKYSKNQWRLQNKEMNK